MKRGLTVRELIALLDKLPPFAIVYGNGTTDDMGSVTGPIIAVSCVTVVTHTGGNDDPRTTTRINLRYEEGDV